MAGLHRRTLVVDSGGSQYPASARRTVSRRPLLSASFCVSRRRCARRGRRDRFGGGGQIFANMIEINQIAALAAELLLHLPDDPWRAVADRVNP